MAALTDVAALDAHMATASYVTGTSPTQDDISVFKAISAPGAAFPNALRWYKHINTFSDFKAANLPGQFSTLSAPSSSAAPAPAPAQSPAKKEKPQKEQQPKKEKPKKEDKPKEEPKKEEPDPEKEAKEAAKAAAKLLKAVIKEGGKKGVEIEGASDMGGLDFFCTTIETPEGDQPLLLTAMYAMNADPDPEAEDRKGCSGHVGKMIFSAGTKQLAIVAYVPKNESNKSAENVDVTKWIESVAAATGGTVTVTKAPAPATFTTPDGTFACPHGGFTAEAVVLSDPEKGKFALKDKDAAMAAAFNYLREHGAFPEDTGDSDDEPCFGDDAFDNIDEM